MNNAADSMKLPSAHASIRYSGQCARTRIQADRQRDAGEIAGSVLMFIGVRSTAGLEAGVQRHAAVDEQAGAVM